MSRRSSRDALVMAIIGRPEGLPGPERADLASFWRRFDSAAPVHVRFGFGVATLVLATVSPRLQGHVRGLASLDGDTAEAVVRRALRSPIGRPLRDAATLVACFAYFDDDRIETIARGPLQVGLAVPTGDRS